MRRGTLSSSIGALIAIFAVGCGDDTSAPDEAAPASRSQPSSEGFDGVPARSFDDSSAARGPAVPATDADLETRTDELSIVLPRRIDQPVRLHNATLDVSASFDIVGASDRAGAPERLEQGVIRWSDALGSGLHVEMHTKNGGVEDWVTLVERRDEVRYRLHLDRGVAAIRVVAGVIELLDRNGTPAMRVTDSVIVGANGVRTRAAMDVEGCAVDRSPRAPWGRPMVAPGASDCDVVVRIPEHGVVYPARLDPTWTATGSDMVATRLSCGTMPLADGRILLVGGRGTNGFNDSAELFDPATTTFSPTGSLPETVIRFTAQPLPDGRALVMGGQLNYVGLQPVVAETQIWSPGTGLWSPGPAMSVEREDLASVRFADGRVGVFGGLRDDGSTTGVVEIFNPANDSFAISTPMPVPQSDARATRIGTQIYLTSGRTSGGGESTDFRSFDPSNESWTLLQSLPAPRFAHSAAALDDHRILVQGGVDGNLQPNQSIAVFDTLTNGWTQSLPVLPSPLFARLVSAPGTGLFIVGGCPNTACVAATNAVFWVDPTTLELVDAGSVGTPTYSSATARLVDGRSLVAGGGTKTVEVLRKAYLFAPLDQSAPCVQGFECGSGHCVDGLCCDDACTGDCMSCRDEYTNAGDGHCGAIVAGTDPESECDDQGADGCNKQNGNCGASGCAHYQPGASCVAHHCSSGLDCAVGLYCVDGLCCDSPCDGLCEACRDTIKGTNGSTPHDGLCEPITAGVDDEEDCPGDNKNCESIGVCDGARSCVAASKVCAPYSCSTDGCYDSCQGDSDCATGNACFAKYCEGDTCDSYVCAPAAEICTADQTTRDRLTGVVIDCNPYHCRPDGGCYPGCESVRDCSSGFVCIDGGCVEGPPEEGGDSGCACSIPASPSNDERGPALAILALSSLAIARSRRRRRP